MAWKLFGKELEKEQLPAELRSILAQMQRERSAFEALTSGARDAAQNLSQLTQPITDAQRVVLDLQARVKGLERVVPVLATLDQQTEEVSRTQRRTETQLTQTSDDAKALRDEIATLRGMLEAALALKNDLAGFIELGGGFKALRMDADTLTGELRDVTAGFGRLRETVERAANQVTNLHELMRDVDAKTQKHEQSLQTLVTLDTRVQELNALHTEMEQHTDAIRAQHEAAKRADAELRTRLAGLKDEVQRAVKRFEGENQGLDAASQRIVDLRSGLNDMELRFRSLEESSRTITDVRSKADALSAQLTGITESVSQLETEAERSHEGHAATKAWLKSSMDSLAALRNELAVVEELKPLVDRVRSDAERVTQSQAQIESRGKLIDDMNSRLASLASLGGQIEERTAGLLARIDGADERFLALAGHADEAARIEKIVPQAMATVAGAERRLAAVDAGISALESRAENLEGLAERTRALGQELQLRQTDLAKATEHLDRASRLREQAAGTAHELETRANQLGGALAAAYSRLTEINGVMDELDSRAGTLRFAQKRMAQFEERLAKWEAIETQVDQAEERLGRIEALLADTQSSLASLQAQKALLDHAVEQAGSLAFHTKQAEVLIATLRMERETGEKMRAAVAEARDVGKEGRKRTA